MALATVFNPTTKERKQITVGDPNAFAGGWILETPTNNLQTYQSPAGNTTSTSTGKATLYGPSGQKEVVDVGSGRASTLQSQGWGLNSYEGSPETQESVDQLYSDAVSENPKISELVQGGSSLEEVINALQTGNLAGIVDFNGQPFSSEDQQTALAQANDDNKLYYEALQAKETADAESSLAQQQDDYQNYLINSGQSFEADKTKSDQQSADSGVLFSGSRVQKEKNLERAYNQDQSYTQNKVAGQIGSTANDFQYKYGNTAADNLNQYYNLGSNTFNANKARGGVGSSTLSSVYNPSNYNFQGTRNTERSANSNTRAAGYLWNKGNKLLSSGYNNQY